jgi:hypothetical protein
MTKIVKMYKQLEKDQLIKAWKLYLQENKKSRNPRDGFNSRGNGLERPKINNKIMSWKEFNKLPKDALVVFTYTNGLDANTLKRYIEEGLLNKKLSPREDPKIITKFVYHDKHNSYLIDKGKAQPILTETHKKFKGHRTKGPNSFKGYHHCHYDCCDEFAIVFPKEALIIETERNREKIETKVK